MSNVNPIQTAFNGGEISPRLHKRIDSDGYRRSLKTCLNFIPTPQGSAQLRQGSTLKDDPRHSDDSKAFELPWDGREPYVVFLDEGRLSIRDPSGTGAPLNLGTIKEIQNESFEEELKWWYVRASGATTDYLLPFGGEPNPAYIDEASKVLYIGQHSAKVWQRIVRGRAVPPRYLTLVVASVGGTINVKIGTTKFGNDQLNETFTTTGTKSFSVPNSEVTDVYVTIEPANGTSYCSIESINLRCTSGDGTLSTPWSDPSKVQMVYETGANRAIFVSPEGPPMELFWVGPAETQWDFRAIWFTSQPDWSAGWPSVAEIFQGRLWLARGDTFWASRPATVTGGSLFDFNRGSSNNANDSFTYDVATKGVIRWMRAHGRRVMIGTSIGEHLVTSESGAINVNDINVEEICATGSKVAPCVKAGTQVLFISADGRKVHTLAFSTERDQWDPVDLAFAAEHVTLPGALEVHYARDPLGLVVVVLADGTLACCTYVRAPDGSQLAAWWRVQLGGGRLIKSVAVVNTSLGAALWMATYDPAAPATGFYVEELRLWERCSRADGAIFVTSYALAPSGSLAVAVGAAWAGRTVHVNAAADGEYLGSGVVSAGGTVSGLQSAGANNASGFWVGQFCPTPTLETLPLEGGSPRGSAQSSKRRWPKVAVALNDSDLPLVNGERPGGWAADHAAPYVTDDVFANTRGWDSKGSITITQDRPSRTEVLAIFGVAQANEV